MPPNRQLILRGPNLVRVLTAGLLLHVAVAIAAETAAPANEANIARVTAMLLERSHFAAHRHNEDVSGRFLDRYLDQLDGARLLFLESDVAEFAPYRSSLEKLTLEKGDLSAAQKIFDRYLERLEQRVDYVTGLLETEQFDFSGRDTYTPDRREAPRPRDLAEARQLWRQLLRFEYLQEKLGKKPPEEIATTLRKRYERTRRTMKQYGTDRVFEAYLNALAHVYDPHSDYLGPRQLEEFSIGMKLSLFGIGAVLQFDDGYSKIRELVPGGPADASGQIKPGDRIVAVAQEGEVPVDIVEMPLSDAVQLIRGPKGTTVTLTLWPADAADASVRQTVALVRDEIKIESQRAKARLVDLPRGDGAALRLGIIELPSFYIGDDGPAGATADVAALMGKLKEEKMQGLILDLRRNGGGSLEEAIRLSGLFIASGPVVQTKDAEGKVNVSPDPDPAVVYDGPLVVLTSHLSASASEILAGALQDYGRALIVGDASTFGKGTVQTMIPLGPLMKRFGLEGGENPGALKLTIRKFYRPGGSSTQLKGVTADIVLPSHLAAFKLGEGEMEEALPWDEVTPARYESLDRVAPYLSTLRQKSARRVATDPEFVWLRQDLERAKQRQEQGEVSLNEKIRRREIAQQESREKSRDKARARRRPPEQTEYAIALKDVNVPGLPAPQTTAANPNAPLTAATKIGPDAAIDDSSSADKEKPEADLLLEETKRILADYIEMLPAGSGEISSAR